MKPRRLHSDTSLSITSGYALVTVIGGRAGRIKGVRTADCVGRAYSLRYSGIELRAQPRLVWRRPSENSRDDLLAVKAAVLDEDLVRVVTRDDDTGDEHP